MSEFISRWSRRKQQARRADLTPSNSREPGPPETASPGQVGTGEGQNASPAPAPLSEALSAEEIAALPRLEELTAESDLAPFLRGGVPAALRKAALRRMWALDPAIRDFVGEARDYSWDWNVAGGVPGSGALSASPDHLASARAMFSRPGGEKARHDVSTGPELGREGDLASDPAVSAPATTSLERPEPERRLARSVEPGALTTAQPAPETAGALPEARRRHGSALPKLDLF